MTDFETTAGLFCLDIRPLKISRSEFLARMVSFRLIEREKNYEKAFDRFFELLENKIYNQGIEGYLEYLSAFSETSTILYENLLKDLKSNADFLKGARL